MFCTYPSRNISPWCLIDKRCTCLHWTRMCHKVSHTSHKGETLRLLGCYMDIFQHMHSRAGKFQACTRCITWRCPRNHSSWHRTYCIFYSLSRMLLGSSPRTTVGPRGRWRKERSTSMRGIKTCLPLDRTGMASRRCSQLWDLHFANRLPWTYLRGLWLRRNR